MQAESLLAVSPGQGARHEHRHPGDVARGTPWGKTSPPWGIVLYTPIESRQGFHACRCGRYSIVCRGAGMVCAEAQNKTAAKGGDYSRGMISVCLFWMFYSKHTSVVK